MGDEYMFFKVFCVEFIEMVKEFFLMLIFVVIERRFKMFLYMFDLD